VVGAMGCGVVGGGAAGEVVVAGDGVRDAVGEASGTVAAAGGTVVAGATACGRRSPRFGCESAVRAGCRGGIDRRGTGASAMRITRVSDTRVTAATRADVPNTGKRGSKTPQRVSELDTPWLSAWPASALKTSPSVVVGASSPHGPA
jgi:hypothetical protein